MWSESKKRRLRCVKAKVEPILAAVVELQDLVAAVDGMEAHRLDGVISRLQDFQRERKNDSVEGAKGKRVPRKALKEWQKRKKHFVEGVEKDKAALFDDALRLMKRLAREQKRKKS